MKIIVPATSANIGPGFDSVGVAVSKYLVIEVVGQAERWQIDHDLGAKIPSDKRNLLLKTALKLAPDLQPHHLKMVSDIPLARGLGSSSSVIVAGIELANQLAGLNLSAADKLKIATKIEGHPDNVAPAIYGNLVIASYVNYEVNAVVADMPATSFIAYIPRYELKTSDSRKVLPKELAYKEAVAASSVANVAVAALLRGDMVAAGKAIESDRFHEAYRQSLIGEFDQVKGIAKANQAYATYLSGAGPTIMVLAPLDQAATIKAQLDEAKLGGQTFILEVDKEGVRCQK